MTDSQAQSTNPPPPASRRIDGVIFDSGGVLVRPVGGEWSPTLSLEQVLAERGIAWQSDKLSDALAAGSDYLDSVHHIRLRDEDEERDVMARYHAVILAGVGVAGDTFALGREIQRREEARPAVEPFAWTVPVLESLQTLGIPVVVLSNAWPSLRRLHRGLGIDRFVRAMVISGEEGVNKPDERLFLRALEELDTLPERTLFVDDWPGHVEAALRLGIRAIWLRPPAFEPQAHLETITDLRDLLSCFPRPR